MRTDELQTLLDHMYWVADTLLAAAEKLADEAFLGSARDRRRDLRAILVHELDVEWSWRLSLQGRPRHEWDEDAELRPEDFPDVAAIRRRWTRDEREMRAWVASLSDEDLAAEVRPGLAGGRPLPLWQYLVHIVTHAAHQHADAAARLTEAGSSPGEIGFLEFVLRRSRPREAADPEA